MINTRHTEITMKQFKDTNIYLYNEPIEDFITENITTYQKENNIELITGLVFILKGYKVVGHKYQ